MQTPTRRDFLRSASVLPVAGRETLPATPEQPLSPLRDSRFRPSARPEAISPSLYLFRDTCNVYLIRQGRRGLLVDFGSGAILEHLPALGVEQVDWILHTHHHRDQCQGDFKAVARRIPIAVPAHEHHLFADAENFWRNRRIFHLYYVRNNFNTLSRSVPVARKLEDYTSFRWGELDLFVFPTPGHTPGSISLIATIDGRRVAFTGDLIYAPGKIWTLYDTQVNYGGAEGIDLGIYSLARLAEQSPELLLPSHGEPIRDPSTAIPETIRRLTEYYRFQTGSEPSEMNRALVVSPHLIAHYQTNSSFYAILSDSGKAMFIDYGSASSTHFRVFEQETSTTSRIRFVEHSIQTLQKHHGVRSIDVAMPSHMHDDHINGFPHLIRHYGTKIWCYENMKDVLENPRGYNLGCILGEPIPVDRTFRHGERFRWEEYEFEITHSPGHTEYQMALFVTIDGRRVAFTGDAFFATLKDGTMRHNLIFRNQVTSECHLKSIRNLIEHEPELIAPGHGQPFAVDRKIMEATYEKFKRQRQFFIDLLPEGGTEFGLDPSWVSLYPYQLLARPGEALNVEVRVRNYKPEPMQVEVALVTPREWEVNPEVVRLEIAGRAEGRRTVRVEIPAQWTPPAPRFAITADVVRDGDYLGQVTEAVVELAS